MAFDVSKRRTGKGDSHEVRPATWSRAILSACQSAGCSRRGLAGPGFLSQAL